MTNSLSPATNPESLGLSSDRLQRITNLLEGYVEQGNLPGFIAAIYRRGQTAYFAKAGWMDMEAHKPMEEDAIFMIASMTKPITAVAAMLLYEEGHFHLNTPISKFLPGFADTSVYAGTGPQGGIYLDDRIRDITFRHLFTHTSGLSYGWDENDPVDRMYQEAQKEMEARGEEPSLLSLAEALAKVPLAFQPGSHWRYGLSIDVLGALVEVISGTPYPQFLQERIFDPLGMVDTGFWMPPEKQGRRATIYAYDTPEVGLQARREIQPPPEMPAFPSPGGGLWSTAPDYVRFIGMLVNKGVLEGTRLLSPSTVELFSLNQCPEEALPYGFEENDLYHAGYGYSLGTRVLMDIGKSGMAGSVGEFGWDGRFHTYFWIDPARELGGLLMLPLEMEGRHPSNNSFKQLTYQALID